MPASAPRVSRFDWILDSGCSHHMTFDPIALDDLRKDTKDKGFVLRDDRVISICGHGRSILKVDLGQVVLVDILLASDLGKNLLSITQLASMGLKFWFEDITCKVFHQTNAHSLLANYFTPLPKARTICITSLIA